MASIYFHFVSYSTTANYVYEQRYTDIHSEKISNLRTRTVGQCVTIMVIIIIIIMTTTTTTIMSDMTWNGVFHVIAGFEFT